MAVSGDLRWAIVTGAGGGIGGALCLHLARQGMAAFMVDHQAAPLEAAAERVREAGGRAATFVADVAVADRAKAAVAAAQALGRVDALANIAGGSGPTPVATIEAMTDEQWTHVIDINLFSTFLFCRAAVPAMRAQGYGRIVNMSSIVARGRKGPVTTQGARLAYATAKAAIVGFTKQLAKDEAPHGITVNCVLPGLILSQQGSRIRERFNALPADQRAAMLADSPTGRAGEAAEVAAPIAFLLSEAAAYVSAVELPIDGGLL